MLTEDKMKIKYVSQYKHVLQFRLYADFEDYYISLFNQKGFIMAANGQNMQRDLRPLGKAGLYNKNTMLQLLEQRNSSALHFWALRMRAVSSLSLD
ncbi:hypothetical protein [Oceanobacillus neutriphilus]|uniref:Uncharacterized protein n=1 Tax=Oceanobacillus neutriphilus TaxID=531815 RepID=A0ABQ2NXN1_9BACI|nr:hypothetical protein [Oceanobacillus neutriphilus]GGP13107.1 hypothetical protein GCM10011346_31760 [Oceanobacillus neutriphilus]